ncbi:G_PROTEIN_RECEP_F1_2 domain-containing protein [Meloidogyne graminicola]|uniref:G_PROTEIN_RECEP_F1_2 domain-containing protein n=1 Tax=Meloidogyne graminicola TaxID=189291 RepID=A0A8S9ZMY2_9BILA|nr:G_PROTEIN_RECEP_F1_2 domain-containing protein [Meloidogyne graminicola]
MPKMTNEGNRIKKKNIEMGGLDSFCQLKSDNDLNTTGNNISNINNDPSTEAALLRLKSTFRTIIVVISALGVAGNILNLMTLRSPSLRNVPFMFIRALALFDLISLTAILLHFSLEWLQIESDIIIFYEVWIQDVLINSFLVAGLYCAVLLTIERFLLIRKPLSTGIRLLSVENTVLVKIGFALLAALILHAPMSLQWQAKCSEYEPIIHNNENKEIEVHKVSSCLHWARGKFNNRDLLCREPFHALYNYYKMGREFLRFFCVLLLVILNAVIARHLQLAKRNRRLLIKRVSMTTTGTEPSAVDSKSQPHFQIQRNNSAHSPICSNCRQKHYQHINCLQHQNAKASNSSPPADSSFKQIERPATPSISGNRRDLNSLMRSFTEKKLTALMVAICVIFVVMALQNEALDNSFGFQVFRQIANTAEVLNHCLNFFIFCMASSEYCRAFLSLKAVHCLLRYFPFCNTLTNSRISGSVRRRLERTHQLMLGVGNAHEVSALNYDLKNSLRKKSSIGIILTNSENGSSGGCGGVSSGWDGGDQKLWRYRRDTSVTNESTGRKRGSIGTHCTLMVERKSSNTLTTNGGPPINQEFNSLQNQNFSTQVQLLVCGNNNTATKTSTTTSEENCSSTESAIADDFL